MAVPSGATSITGLVNNKLGQAQQAFNTPLVQSAPQTVTQPVAATPNMLLTPTTALAQPAAAPADPAALNQMLTSVMETLLLSLQKKKSGPSLAQKLNNQEFARVRPLEKPIKVKSVGISPLSDAGDE